MKKDDYKTEFEEHRKEISLDEGPEVGDLPSRAELHRKGRKPKKKSGNLMINIILGLFTLIPVLILVYFISDFYSPGDMTSAKGGETGIRFETSNKAADNKTDVTDKDIAIEDDESKESSKDDGKSTSNPETETGVVENPVVNVNPTPEKKPVVKPTPEKKPVVKTEPKPEKKPEPKPTAKTHKVASNENLYRISLKYYGNGTGIDKIKNANGLSSNEISVGQTLVIP